MNVLTIGGKVMPRVQKLRFENDVKEYGFQTCKFTFHNVSMFENDVKEYDFQTLYSMSKSKLLFENDVKNV